MRDIVCNGYRCKFHKRSDVSNILVYITRYSIRIQRGKQHISIDVFMHPYILLIYTYAYILIYIYIYIYTYAYTNRGLQYDHTLLARYM